VQEATQLGWRLNWIPISGLEEDLDPFVLDETVDKTLGCEALLFCAGTSTSQIER